MAEKSYVWKMLAVMAFVMILSTSIYAVTVEASHPGVQEARAIAKHGVKGDIVVKTSQTSPCDKHNDNVVAVFNQNSFMHGAGWINRDSNCVDNKFLLNIYWPISGSATHVLRSFPGSITDGMLVQGEVKKNVASSSDTCWTAKTRVGGVEQFSFNRCFNAQGTWGVPLGAAMTTDTTSSANINTQFKTLKFFEYCSNGTLIERLWSQNGCQSETFELKCKSVNGYERNLISTDEFKAGKPTWTSGDDCSAAQDDSYPYDHWGE